MRWAKRKAPWLFDLIGPKDPKLFPVCYNALVADSIAQVNRITFDSARRWRVATLAGRLIDTTRTMSGGGNQPPRGAMTSKFATETVSRRYSALTSRKARTRRRHGSWRRVYKLLGKREDEWKG